MFVHDFLYGRMQIGLVGAPNSGKSSFFKAATMVDVPIAPYPFTTIKANIGIAYVTANCVCKKFEVKCNPKNSLCINGKRYIPIKLLDVPGLVPGAHAGKGMGNKFLDELRQASCLIHVVDASGRSDAEGKVTSGYDPCETIRFLEEEIDLWFEGIIERALIKFRKKMKFSKVDIVDVLLEQLSGLGIRRQQIMETIEKTGVENTRMFASELRKTSKPIIVAANKIDLPESQENLERMRKEFPRLTIIPTCAVAEIALKSAHKKGLIEYMDDKFVIKDASKIDKKQLKGLDFIKNNILDKYGSTGVQACLNKAVFDVLGYILVYPVANIHNLTDTSGKNVLPDAFLVPRGTTLKEFAGMIHTTMAEKFIGGIDARTKKKVGAEYELKNDDVFEILFQKR